MNKKIPALLGTILVGFLLFGRAAEDPQFESIEEAVPDSIAAPIKTLLDGPALRARMDEQLDAKFWLRRRIPLAESASSDLGVQFGRIQQGTLFGAMKLEKEWRDYKNLPIPPGTYTLRYAVQPADGNHMGVSFYRDFLLLIPASEDVEPQPGWDSKELVAASKGATGTTHPASLALFPVYQEISEPKMVRNDMDQWTLAVPFGDLTLGMVLWGHGEIEGY